MTERSTKDLNPVISSFLMCIQAVLGDSKVGLWYPTVAGQQVGAPTGSVAVATYVTTCIVTSRLWIYAPERMRTSPNGKFSAISSAPQPFGQWSRVQPHWLGVGS